MKTDHTLPWGGVHMRTVQAAPDPDSSQRAITLPADWDDLAAEALADMIPGAGPACLEEAATRWIHMLARGMGAEAMRGLTCLLLLRKAAPLQAVWSGDDSRKPGFIINLARFVNPESGVDVEDFTTSLRLLVNVLRNASRNKHLENIELPLFPPSPLADEASASPPDSCVPTAGVILLTNLDACLAGMGLDYDSEPARETACALAALATLVAREGSGSENCIIPPSYDVVPGLKPVAQAVWEKAASEIAAPLPRVETGFSTPGPVDALLGVEACGLAPVFSPLNRAGQLAESTLHRLAHKGLTLESAFARLLAGENVLAQPGLAAHMSMYKALSGFVDHMPPRPEHPPTVAKCPTAGRGVHLPLPERHQGITKKASVGGHRIFLRTGEYEDGSVGEINVTPVRETPTVRALMDSLGQAVSIGLQYGVPLDAFVETFAYTRFGPGGTVEGEAGISYATSLLDYVFRTLSDIYLGKRLPDAPYEMQADKAESPLLPLDLPSTDQGGERPRSKGLRLVV